MLPKFEMVAKNPSSKKLLKPVVVFFSSPVLYMLAKKAPKVLSDRPIKFLILILIDCNEFKYSHSKIPVYNFCGKMDVNFVCLYWC